MKTEIEKLELHHIAPYLPHRLKIQGNTHKDIQILKGLVNNDVFVESQTTYHYGAWSDLNGIKPILRPLLDLTKEIEHNGEKFVPSEFTSTNFSSLIQNPNDFGFGIYNMCNQLIQWHFDVFGLIEKGLAVDINTLK